MRKKLQETKGRSQWKNFQCRLNVPLKIILYGYQILLNLLIINLLLVKIQADFYLYFSVWADIAVDKNGFPTASNTNSVFTRCTVTSGAEAQDSKSSRDELNERASLVTRATLKLEVSIKCSKCCKMSNYDAGKGQEFWCNSRNIENIHKYLIPLIPTGGKKSSVVYKKGIWGSIGPQRKFNKWPKSEKGANVINETSGKLSWNSLVTNIWLIRGKIPREVLLWVTICVSPCGRTVQCLPKQLCLRIHGMDFHSRN